jgi:non-specific serine/threonine protein kinase
VRASAEAKDKSALLAILVPLQRAAERSTWVKERQADHRLFRPLAWSPTEARAFLAEVPVMEAAGIVVRVPDWWKARKPQSPTVTVTIGEETMAQVGTDAMLDFKVEVTLGDQTLTPEMVKKLLASEHDWIRVKGEWVDLDRARLLQVMDHWKQVERAVGKDGVSFLEGMRLLSGAFDSGKHAAKPDLQERGLSNGVNLRAGRWLGDTLRALRDPAYREDLRAPRGLTATLRPYQADGVSWMDFVLSLGLGACLADDMGLGKTVQVIALLLHAKAKKKVAPSLLLVPASLIGNWQAELERFGPSLRVFIAHASATPADQWSKLSEADLKPYDAVIATHAAPWRLPWLASIRWRFLVLDEAQAIKNPGTKQTNAIKALKADRRIALTGTPIENRLGDLWSIFDFLTPGLLGSARQFGTYLQSLRKAESSDYSALRRLVAPSILRRMKTDPNVVPDLPEKTEMQAFCSLSKKQAALYERSVLELRKILDSVTGIKRRGLVLAFLLRFKQICNHPSQWLGDQPYDPKESGKFDRLREICEPIVGRQEKALIFTQFREMTEPLSEFLSNSFGRPALVLHGGTPVGARRKLVERFQSDDDQSFFVLSIKAGGTGLNLTAASHVVHFDRWWNPAVEDQATDRAFRIGQRRNVLVHKFVCRGTIEEKIDQLIHDKRALSTEVLAEGTQASITELSDREILDLVSLDLNRALTGA